MTIAEPYYRISETSAKEFEQENLTYTLKEVCELFSELDIEQAKLLQSIVFKEAGYFIMIYDLDAMSCLFLMMDSHILALEQGFSLNMSFDYNGTEE